MSFPIIPQSREQALARDQLARHAEKLQPPAGHRTVAEGDGIRLAVHESGVSITVVRDQHRTVHLDPADVDWLRDVALPALQADQKPESDPETESDI